MIAYKICMLYVQSITNTFMQRLKQDKDLVLAITGDEGSGKSALAIQIALASVKDSYGNFFDLEHNVLYSPKFEEMKEKVIGLPRYSTIIADEAIKSLYKLHWQNKMQQFINILYAICRQENKLSILCIPRFADLNEFFRQHRVKFWIHIIDEISKDKEVGHAVMFGKSWSPFTVDAWNMKDAIKEIDDYSRVRKIKETEYSLGQKIHVLSRGRNYIGMIEFGKIPDDIFQKYSELKKKYAYDDMAEPEPSKSKRETTWMLRTQKLVKVLLDQGKTYTEISRILGITQSRLTQIMADKPDEEKEKQINKEIAELESKLL